MQNIQLENEYENTLVYGKNAVAQLLKAKREVDTVLIQDSMNSAQASYYIALAKERGATVKRVHSAKLDKICNNTNHQGIAAFCAQIEYSSIEDIIKIANEKNEPPFVIIADGIEDPHNLGAIIRSALLCGAHGIIIPKRGTAGITPIVLKSSAGAAEALAIAKVSNIGESVRRLKQMNIFVYYAGAGQTSAFVQNLTGGIALVMGSEGKGVSALVKKLCDGCVSLPMAQTNTDVDSFNVSVAGGILMYEIMRQRQQDNT